MAYRLTDFSSSRARGKAGFTLAATAAHTTPIVVFIGRNPNGNTLVLPTKFDEHWRKTISSPKEKSMFEELKGKKALVTGSSTGIGAGVAKAYARLGMSVAVHANSSIEQANQLVSEIRDAGGHAVLVSGNLGNPEVARGVVAKAAKELGGIDVLVNNAGSVVERSTLEDFSEDLFDQVIDVNVKSVLFVTQAALPHLRASKAASIINTGSIAGRNGGRPGSGVYAAAKAAVHSITKNQAREYAAEGIRANTVAPGVIVTPFHKETNPAQMEDAKRAIPLARLGEVEDMTGAYMFLASNAMSGFITGQIIDVNGGAMMA